MEIRSVTGFVDAEWPLNKKEISSFIRSIEEIAAALENEGNHVQSTRLATQPFGRIVDVTRRVECINFAKDLEHLVLGEGVSYLALGPVDSATGVEAYHRIVDILSETNSTFLSTEIASNSGEIAYDRIIHAAEVITEVSTILPDGFKNLFLTALANVKPLSPFLPSAYHAGGVKRISIAIENSALSMEAVTTAASLAMAREAITAIVEKSAEALQRTVSHCLAKREDILFSGFDFSYAPYPRDERSIGALLERLGGERFGGHGSLFASAVLTDALDAANFLRSGFNGLMLAVLEDSILAKRVAEKSLTISELLSYSAVCGTGLDLIALPGDVSASTICGVLLDVAALATRNRKQLTARIMPLPGKRSGDPISFDFEYFAPSIVLTPGEPLTQGLFGPGQTITMHSRL